MNQGKHLSREAKKKIAASRLRRKAVLLLSLILILVGAIGGTMAYFTDYTISVKTFSVGQVSCSVSRSGDTYVINNNGTVPMCVRAAVRVNWENEDGELHWTTPDATVSFNSSTWTEQGGCYYYNSPIAANTSVTGPSITVTEEAPDGYSAKIHVLLEAVQEGADAWDIP
ncbi:MAG: hypothetical protein IJB78_05820 [Oscillospiraceae bacterium]|nr:hypothetical protein [Oscillospiraceae bacterium]